MLIVFRSDGIGDFVKTWGFLRNNRGAVVVAEEELGKLLHDTLGHIVLPKKKGWKLFFNHASGPPSYVSRYNRIVVYRHAYYASEDEYVRMGLASLNEDATIDLRSFCPVCCEGLAPELKKNPGGRILFHVGAGQLQFSKERTADYLRRKVFPLKEWEFSMSAAFAEVLSARGHITDLIAGPAQQENWNYDIQNQFKGLGGSFDDGNLIRLRDRILAAKCFIGFDSGPTHLAAQSGIPTVGLYGPTGRNGVDREFHDLYHAEPVTPPEHLCLIRPGIEVCDRSKPRLAWLKPEEAADRVIRFLDGVYGASVQR